MKSLAKALEAFCAFNSDARDLGVKDVCERTGLRKSQVSKILRAFRDVGLLQQDPVTRRYSVGQRAFSIGSKFVNNHLLAQVGLPIVRQLVEQSGHSTTLSILDSEVVHLLAVEGPLFVDARWRVGRIITFHVSASARVLLAFRPTSDVEAMIARHGMPRLTERTMTEPKALFELLQRIRNRGYDVSRNEGIVGLGALAAPVLGERQDVVASLGMIFPDHFIGIDEQDYHIARLHRAARQISARLGATIYPYGSAMDLAQELRPEASAL